MERVFPTHLVGLVPVGAVSDVPNSDEAPWWWPRMIGCTARTAYSVVIVSREDVSIASYLLRRVDL